MLYRFALLSIISSTALFAASPLDVEQQIDSLLSSMTLEEKLGQMSQSTSMRAPISGQIRQEIRQGRWGSFLNAGSPQDRAEAQRIAVQESRLRIPLLFGRDVIHGYRTIFPIPLGQSASWDPELIGQAAEVAAREASAAGIHWTFAPMLDITRDPRWGRIAETLGEDPYLTSTLGAAMVRGFQGRSLDARNSVAACAKHYVGYGAAEAGRDYNSTFIPEIQLRDVFLPPFHAAVEAGVASVMTAFNALNGVPATGNEFTIRQVLRKEWNFGGLVVSDYESVLEMVKHGFAEDPADAAAKAVRAGVDMEMVSTTYFDKLKQLVEQGAVPMATIDDSVRNILRLKYRLGLFERPERTAVEPPMTAASADVATRLAAESVVLLKNDGALPLAKSVGKIAVIGPLANSPVDQMGSWSMDASTEDVQTPLESLRKRLGTNRVVYVQGMKDSRDLSQDQFRAAVDAARPADVILLFLGEEQILSGEAHSRAFLNLPGAQEALAEQVASAGKPIVTIVMAGRPLTFQNVAARSNAVLYAWHPGSMGGPALADLLFGDRVPSGKLTVTFPRTVGQIPIYYAHLNTGRPTPPGEAGIPMGNPVNPQGYTSKYLDVDFTPEYPFGFGLSYATFDYRNLRLSSPRMTRGGTLTVSVEVANTGSRAGDEVAQLYIRDVTGSVARPVRELKGFQRVHLKPGEARTVSFTVAEKDLAFYNPSMQRVTEPGDFDVWIAPNSDGGLQRRFTLIEER